MKPDLYEMGQRASASLIQATRDRDRQRAALERERPLRARYDQIIEDNGLAELWRQALGGGIEN
jgi:hypothetical protein